MLMIPVVIIRRKHFGQFFIMDLNYFVLFVLESNLRTSSLDCDDVKTSNVIALHFFQNFLVIHGDPTSKMNSY